MPSTPQDVRRITRRYPARTVLHQTAANDTLDSDHTTAQHGGSIRRQERSCGLLPTLCTDARRAHENTKGRFYVKAWSLFARFRVLGPVVSVGVIGRARLGEGGRGAENAPVDAGAAPSLVDRRDLWRATSAVTDHRGCQRAGERRRGSCVGAV